MPISACLADFSFDSSGSVPLLTLPLLWPPPPPANLEPAPASFEHVFSGFALLRLKMLNGMKPRFSVGFVSLVDCGVDVLASPFCSSDRDAPFLCAANGLLDAADDDEDVKEDDSDEFDDDIRCVLLPEAPAALLSLFLGEVASRLVRVLFFLASVDGVEWDSVERELLFESAAEERSSSNNSQSESSLSLPEVMYGTRLVDEDLAPLLDVVVEVLEETVFTDFSGNLLSPLWLLWLLFNSQEGLCTREKTKTNGVNKFASITRIIRKVFLFFIWHLQKWVKV